jgi:hypothetical protein
MTNELGMITQLNEFVNEIELKIKSIGPKDFYRDGNLLSPPDIVIFCKCELEPLRQRLTTILGEDRVEQFFHDCEPKGAASKIELVMQLVNLLQCCCTVVPGVSASFDRDRFLKGLTDLVECVQKGEIPYTFALHITNIDIDEEFHLHDGTVFHKLLPQEMLWKYPVDAPFNTVSVETRRNWLNHCVEAVISGHANPVGLQQCCGIGQSEAMANSICHAFLLADISPKCVPDITHIILNSPLKQERQYCGIGHFLFTPVKLTSSDIELFKNAYRFLKKSDEDRVLRTSIDRYVVGKKRGEHHPNRINEPNWDKIVDYVIAMETMFLTVNGNPISEELSYRFRLNGASLLHIATGEDVRQIFHALNCLYTLRSKVVHGCEETAILKAAKKYLECMKLDRTNHTHSLGCLMLVSKKVEEWIRKLFFYIDTIPMPERPYKKLDGWEDMLWRTVFVEGDKKGI